MDVGWMLLGLAQIMLINIVLSGDNAVVIALACRNLPAEQQRKAIFLGSGGAIALRVVLTFAAAWLLQIPYVQPAGGLLLLWIAFKLLMNDEREEQTASSRHLGAAVRTIITADLVMSLDNVLAVAGAASGNLLLIGLGLASSIPLVIWGSQFLMKLMNRFPVIVLLGVGLLGYTAGKMILSDDTVAQWVHSLSPAVHTAIPLLLGASVVAAGRALERRRRHKRRQMQADCS
ncbi:TerC family protein [Paenibacillus doosanensis]|uniref:Integral membrane protein TerC family protein n=1 Tax=Paenibacillus konkukensis TaxID=2020716 RepID=A0ABY4RLT7_9BACL|nr:MULTISPECIES: TerC family protein [Paenibacillus]MCS7462669.1 TerC family protein [Paenibacillus doosanensis]UQZ82282.1 Integral membrane protein TerC family protein [Paenibacillus konkukensis]